jgi:hypothetical protein
MAILDCSSVYSSTDFLLGCPICTGNVSITLLCLSYLLTDTANSPRWLIQKGRVDQARKSLEYFREGRSSGVEIEAEITEIKQDVEGPDTTTSSWTALFLRRDLFQRLWRAALLQFMAQMCGATAIVSFEKKRRNPVSRLMLI